MSSKHSVLLVIVSLLLSIPTAAQTVLFEENVKDTYPKERLRGPNKRHYTHWYVDYGFFVSETESQMGLGGADIRYGLSHTFDLGYRYKLRLTNWLAFGANLSYQYLSYHIKQNDNKTFPRPVYSSLSVSQYDKERLQLNLFSFEIYERLNFGKRGNTVGTFWDVGLYVAYMVRDKHFIQDDHLANQPQYVSVTRIQHLDLDFTEEFYYGLRTRIGRNRYVLSAQYRLSDMFSDDLLDLELPRLSIGLQVGLHE